MVRTLGGLVNAFVRPWLGRTEIMDKNCRRDLKKAEREGIRIETNAPFTEVMALCEKSLQRRKHTTEFLTVAERIEAVLRNAGRCQGFLARNREGVAISGVWIVWDEKRAYYLLGGYGDSATSSNAAALTLWHDSGPDLDL